MNDVIWELVILVGVGMIGVALTIAAIMFHASNE